MMIYIYIYIYVYIYIYTYIHIHIYIYIYIERERERAMNVICEMAAGPGGAAAVPPGHGARLAGDRRVALPHSTGLAVATLPYLIISLRYLFSKSRP